MAAAPEASLTHPRFAIAAALVLAAALGACQTESSEAAPPLGPSEPSSGLANAGDGRLLTSGTRASGVGSDPSETVPAPDAGAPAGAGDAGVGASPGADAGSGANGSSAYDDAVLADGPVAFWSLRPVAATERDRTGNGHDGTYEGGPPGLAALPDGEIAADFNGSSEYLTVPSAAAFSITTTGSLTWEAWIRPDVLDFPHASSSGYVAWMGKCEVYAPTCEWGARMYSATTTQGRCNRLSAYAFNPSAGLGSGAYWQPTCGLLLAGQWYHVVGEYSLRSQPAGCANAASYPGSINIWVNGVPWDQAAHGATGCMSQYDVVPAPGASPLDIGTMARDTWFAGAIGKVALYDGLLTQAQIARHFQAMTGRAPAGSCASDCSW
jgi:hypothetical protein